MNERDVAVAVGQIIGIMMIPAIFIGIGILVQNRINKDRDYESSVSWPRNLGIGLGLLSLIGYCSAPSPRTGSMAATNDVMVQQATLASQDVCPSDINNDDFKAYGDQLAHLISQDAKAKYDLTLNPAEFRVTSAKTVRASGNVCRTEAIYPETMYLLQFSGQVNDSVENVVCETKSGRKFEFAGSECERRVESVYGKLSEVTS